MNDRTELTRTNTEQPAIFDEAAEKNNVFTFTSTLKELRKNLDPDLLRHRKGGRGSDGNARTIEYVEWHTVADILDETAPNWGHAVKDIRSVGDFVIVTVAITIEGVTREGIGTGSARSEMGIKKAEHDALKRAAVKFGIARELYRREPNEGPRAETGKETAIDPVARSIADLITTKQLGMIRAMSRERSVDADALCKELLKCRISELSRKAASVLIEHLQADPIVVPMRKAG